MQSSSLWKAYMPISSEETFKSGVFASIALFLGAALLGSFRELAGIAFVVTLCIFVFYILIVGFTAKYFQCYTKFKTRIGILVMGVLSALILPIGVILPGTLIVQNAKRPQEEVFISIAGILSIFVIAIISVTLTLFFNIFQPIALIASWITLMFLFPAFQTDGHKIMHWNKYVYGSFVLLGILLFALSF